MHLPNYLCFIDEVQMIGEYFLVLLEFCLLGAIHSRCVRLHRWRERNKEFQAMKVMTALEGFIGHGVAIHISSRYNSKTRPLFLSLLEKTLIVVVRLCSELFTFLASGLVAFLGLLSAFALLFFLLVACRLPFPSHNFFFFLFLLFFFLLILFIFISLVFPFILIFFIVGTFFRFPFRIRFPLLASSLARTKALSFHAAGGFDIFLGESP